MEIIFAFATSSYHSEEDNHLVSYLLYYLIIIFVLSFYRILKY